MLFFVGWPKVIPLKNSEVVDIQHNSTKKWTVILTKDRISIWTFFLNENILLGYYKRTDLSQHGCNKYGLFCHDSNKIAVIVCFIIINIEMMCYIENIRHLIYAFIYTI